MVELDKHLFILLNGLGTSSLDSLMWNVSETLSWLPLGILVLWLVYRKAGLRFMLLTLLMAGVAVLLADQFSAHVIKPLVSRPRPTHEPSMMHLVRVVNGYRGGSYGFVSSHAANVFAVATMTSLIFRNIAMTLGLMSWATFVSYSRIYLGVHYVGDVLCGALLGALIGWGCGYFLMRMSRRS